MQQLRKIMPTRLAQPFADALLAFGAVVAAFLLSTCLASAHAQEKAESLRPEVARLLADAQELLKAQKYAEALAKLQAVDGTGGKTPYESYVLERLRAASAAGAGDTALAEKSFTAVLAANRLTPAEQAQVFGSLAAMFYRAKDYPRTVQWATRYVNADGPNPQLREVLIQSLYLTNDYAGAARQLQVEIKASEAAGKPPDKERVELLASSYLKAKDEPGYTSALEVLAAHYPKPEYWADLISRTQKKSGFSDRLSLDAFRLLRSTAGLRDASEFMEMAQLAVEAGFPVEAKGILEQGYSSNALGQGADAVRQKRLRDTVSKQAADDARQLALGRGPAEGAKDGTGHVNQGLSYVLHGQYDKGLPMMEHGIAIGGLKQPEDAKLRLGVAYLQAGQKDKALRLLKTVRGADGTADLARLWVLHAQRP